jgi:ABC-type multidrug transport system ATPase subunit
VTVDLRGTEGVQWRLGRVRVTGHGRIANASMKIRGKVTAAVGPNESGKSTLLRALASASNGIPFNDGPGGDIPGEPRPPRRTPHSM